MLTRRADAPGAFTRRDGTRLGVAAAILALSLTAILGIDVALPTGLQLTAGEPAPRDIVAPADRDFVSQIRTEEARQAARDAVPDRYDYTTGNAIAIAAAQQRAFEQRVDAIDAAFSADVSPEDRTVLLDGALARLDLPEADATTLLGLERGRWADIRTEAARVLDVTMRFEVRDSEVESAKLGLADQMAGDLTDDERFLAAALISPLIVGNSSYSQEVTDAEREQVAAAVQPVRVGVQQGQVLVRQGDPIDEADLEMLEALGLNDDQADLSTFAGWLLFAALIVGFLLGWLWRFRPGLWHRNSVLVLIGLLVFGATVALKLTAGRSILTYFLPTAAIGMLLTILLDATIATFVMALIAIVAGAVNGSSLEIAAYVFLGGMAGIVTVRRGDKLQVFVQAGIAVAVVNALVVSVFSLLGERGSEERRVGKECRSRWSPYH